VPSDSISVRHWWWRRYTSTALSTVGVFFTADERRVMWSQFVPAFLGSLRADPPLTARTMFRESLPVVAVLLFWSVLSWPTIPGVDDALRTAGLAMVTLFVVVRGVGLSRRVSAPVLSDLGVVLRENVRAALPAAGWFVAAHLVAVLESLWQGLGLPGLFTSPRGALVRLFALTGVATVGQYAVAVGTAAIRGGLREE
jgi:hypothetical protein